MIKGERETPIILEDNLKEINMGEWEGQTFSTIKDKYPRQLFSFWNTPHSIVIKTLMAFFKDYPLEKLWEPPFIQDTSLTIVELNGKERNVVIEGEDGNSEREVIEMLRRAVGAIVFHGNKFLIVHKSNINTLEGKQMIKGEWDFIKGGIEESEKLFDALLRELQEETGSIEYNVIKEFHEKIRFDFPDEIKEKIGYTKQETTMFLVEFLGDKNALHPNDDEISNITFVEEDKVVEILTHQNTRDYFIKYLTAF